NGDGDPVLSSHLTGSGQANLKLDASFGDAAGPFNPHLLADLNVGWNIDGPATAHPLGDEPSVAVNNVRLDVGSFLNHFVRPLIAGRNWWRSPLEPVAELPLTKVRVVSEISGALEKGPYYLADLAGDDPLVDLAGVIEAINAVDTAPAPAGGTVDLGSFTLA